MRTRVKEKLLNWGDKPVDATKNSYAKETIKCLPKNVKNNNKNKIKQNKDLKTGETTNKILHKIQIPDKKCYVRLKIIDKSTLEKLLNVSKEFVVEKHIPQPSCYVKLQKIKENLTEKKSTTIIRKNVAPIYKQVEVKESVNAIDEYDFVCDVNSEENVKKRKNTKITKKDPKWKIFNDKKKLLQANKKIRAVRNVKKKILTNLEVEEFCNTVLEINNNIEKRIKTNSVADKSHNISELLTPSKIVESNNSDIIRTNDVPKIPFNNTVNNISFNPVYYSSPFRYQIAEKMFRKHFPQSSSTPKMNIRNNNTENNISNIENINPLVVNTSSNRDVLKSILKPSNRSPLKEINQSVSFFDKIKFNSQVPSKESFHDVEKMLLNEFKLSNRKPGDINNSVINNSTNTNHLRNIIFGNSNISENSYNNSVIDNTLDNIENESVISNNIVEEISIVNKENNIAYDDNENKDKGTNLRYEILKDFNVFDDDDNDNIDDNNDELDLVKRIPLKNTLKERLKQLRKKQTMNRIIKPQPKPIPTIFTTNIKQLDIRDVIQNNDKNTEPIELFEPFPDNDVEIVHYNNKNRRSYGLPNKRKRVKTITDEESDAEEMIVKKKNVKKKKKDIEFDMAIAELNKTFAEVDTYNLIIE